MWRSYKPRLQFIQLDFITLLAAYLRNRTMDGSRTSPTVLNKSLQVFVIADLSYFNINIYLVYTTHIF